MTEHDATSYEIRVRGHLDDRWIAWFDGLSIDQLADGSSVIAGPVVDQAALHGLLRKLSDLGLVLESLAQVPAPSTNTPSNTNPSGATR